MFIDSPSEFNKKLNNQDVFFSSDKKKKVHEINNELETKVVKLVKFYNNERRVVCLFKTVDGQYEGVVTDYYDYVVYIELEDRKLNVQISDVYEIEILEI